jgi:hypothetical protein
MLYVKQCTKNYYYFHLSSLVFSLLSPFLPKPALLIFPVARLVRRKFMKALIAEAIGIATAARPAAKVVLHVRGAGSQPGRQF